MAELGSVTEEIQRGSHRSKLRRGMLVALFSLASATLAAELLLRLSGHRESLLEERLSMVNRSWVALSKERIFEQIADPVRRYAMRPGASCKVDGWTFHVTPHRTRGADFPLEKPANERRLLCIGDSYAFGMWCDDDETLVEQLVRRANERERELDSKVTWRAINQGVPGYHSGQQRIALEEEGLAFEPDVVLLYFNSNDLEKDGFFYASDLGVLRRDYLPLPTFLRRMLWDVSHLYGWISSAHARTVESGPTPYLDPRVPVAHVREDNREYTRRAIGRIVELCRERGIPIFFVNQPLMSYLGDARDPDWPVQALVDWAEALRSDLELPGLNLLGWMRGYEDGVDHLSEGAPPEFILDTYFADARIQDALRKAQERAHERGLDWEKMTFSEQVACFEGLGGELSPPPDFHLSAEGYGHLARLIYPHMRAAGMLP